MKSLGVIEMRGFAAAIQAVDAACKSASVDFIGYRKVGAGLVSVCFEGEISAIHTAIERGLSVAAAIDKQQVRSLVIARPEKSVVASLSNLKGHPVCTKASAGADVTVEAEALSDKSSENSVVTSGDAQPIVQAESSPAQAEDKSAAIRRGKKA